MSITRSGLSIVATVTLDTVVSYHAQSSKMAGTGLKLARQRTVPASWFFLRCISATVGLLSYISRFPHSERHICAGHWHSQSANPNYSAICPVASVALISNRPTTFHSCGSVLLSRWSDLTAARFESTEYQRHFAFSPNHCGTGLGDLHANCI